MKTQTMILMAAFIFGLFSCSENEETSSKVTILSKATVISPTSGARIQSEIVLEEFKINIREIEFEYDEPDAESETDSETEVENIYEDVKLKGPFELNLLDNSGAGLDQIITSTDIPNGNFEEIEFKLHKNEVSSDNMYGKSVYASGNINGIPFVFWHDTDEEFEIDFEDVNQNIILTGESLQVIINFNLGLLFNADTGIDFSQVADGNENGIIEIHPDDADGNSWLADILKDALEDATDLIEDQDD